MSRHRQIELLLAKADQDEYVLNQFVDDDNSPDEVFGFHAQQAAEKMLKAVLAHRGVAFPFTHRLEELIDLSRDSGIDVPDAFEDLRYLTPFAVEFRYDILPPEREDVLDKRAIRCTIAAFRAWAENQVAS